MQIVTNHRNPMSTAEIDMVDFIVDEWHKTSSRLSDSTIALEYILNVCTKEINSKAFLIRAIHAGNGEAAACIHKEADPIVEIYKTIIKV